MKPVGGAEKVFNAVIMLLPAKGFAAGKRAGPPLV
jgi:hypothetical protein